MSLIGEALDLLRRYGDVVGINWDKGPSVLDRVVSTGVANLAGSPILAAAQITIQGMKTTTGSGEPQAGEAFEKSADLYEEAGNLLIDAAPIPDRWDGTAAGAYGAKSREHRGLTLEVSAADQEMRNVLSRLAAQVTSTRTDLQGAIDFLSDYDTSTSWMNFIPGGAAVKAASDAAVAASQLGAAEVSLGKLLAESALVAHSMRVPLGRYEEAAKQKMLDSDPDDERFPCGEPFGDERKDGTLPKRTDTERPFVPPEPVGPAADYPSATPYQSPAPR